jgi:hypothetical protein
MLWLAMRCIVSFVTQWYYQQYLEIEEIVLPSTTVIEGKTVLFDNDGVVTVGVEAEIDGNIVRVWADNYCGASVASCLTTACSDGFDREMSMPGSSRYAGKETPKGLVRLCVGDHLVGMGFRVGDYLITAYHVAVNMDSDECNLSRVVGGKILSYKHMLEFDNAILFHEELDFAVFEITPPVWSVLGVSTLKFSRPVINKGVQVYGEDKLRPWHSFGAITGYGKRPMTLEHNATSHHASSGSPLICHSNVVGIHLGADRLRGANVALAINAIADILVPATYIEESDYNLSAFKRGEFGPDDTDVLFVSFKGRNGRQIMLKETQYADYHDMMVRNEKLAQDLYERGQDEEIGGRSREEVYASRDDKPQVFSPTPVQRRVFRGKPWADEPLDFEHAIEEIKSQAKPLAIYHHDVIPVKTEASVLERVVELGGYQFQRGVKDGNLISLGKMSVGTRGAKSKMKGKCLLAAQNIAPQAFGLKDYDWPPNGPDVEYKSLKQSADGHVVTKPPVDLARVIDEVTKLYPKVEIDPLVRKFDRESLTIAVKRMINDPDCFNADGSPGFPYMSLATKNKDLFEKHGEFILDAIVSRALKLADFTFEQVSKMSAEERVLNHLCDPVRVFVKQEPHKLTKLADGKVRLIASVSIVDQGVERLFNSVLNKTEIANWRTIPSKAGMGLTDEDMEFLYDDVMRGTNNQPVKSDMTGFDWTVNAWLLDADTKIRMNLMSLTSKAASKLPLKRALRNFADCMQCSVLSLSNGVMYVLPFKGVQKSGRYNTTSTNSRCRTIAAHLVGAKYNVAMGDDCVEDYCEGALAKYKAMGLKPKFYEKMDSSFSFCSMEFLPGHVFKPENYAKGLFNLLEFVPSVHSPLQSRFQQFRQDFRHMPEFVSAVDRLLKQVGWYLQNSKQEIELDGECTNTSSPQGCHNTV